MKSLKDYIKEDALNLGLGNNLFTTPLGTTGMGGVAPMNTDPMDIPPKGRKRKINKKKDCENCEDLKPEENKEQ